MSSYTPGPWYYSGFDCIYQCTSDSPGEPRLLAKVYHSDLADLLSGSAEKQANGRLIAAAPETAAERDRLKEVNAELLAALRPLAFFSGSFRDEEDQDRLHEMFAVARAAIAKAEGKS